MSEAPHGVELKLLSHSRVHDGELSKWSHWSQSNKCEMTFNLFLPDRGGGRVPLLYWLSGLTCNEDNFAQKAGAFRALSAARMACVMPDTSTRVEVAGDGAAGWAFGRGAGYYVDATQQPFSQHYQNYTYITVELPAILEHNFRADIDFRRNAIAGHSVGGFGALMIALRHPTRFRSVSLFAPVTDAAHSAWTATAFAHYLGSAEAGASYDPVVLLRDYRGPALPVRIDQGGAGESARESREREREREFCHLWSNF